MQETEIITRQKYNDINKHNIDKVIFSIKFLFINCDDLNFEQTNNMCINSQEAGNTK